MASIAATNLLLVSFLLSQPAGENERPSLVEQLRSPGVEVRLTGLWRFEPFDEPVPRDLPAAIPLLLELLEDVDARVRAHAARLVSTVEIDKARAGPKLKRLLNDDHPGVRIAAANSLWKMRREHDGLAQVAAPLLNANDPETRLLAANLLWGIGAPAEDVIPALIRLLDDDDSLIREGAASALEDIGPEARGAAISLANQLRKRRSDAGDALRRIGPEAKAALPLLIEMLDDERSARWVAHWGYSVGEESAYVLAQMENDGEQALIAALSSEEVHERASALGALSRLPRISETVARRVIPFVLAEDQKCQRRACWVLRRHGGPLALQALIGGLKHPDDSARAFVADVLGELGPQAAAAVKPLISALGDGDSQVRGQAAEALGKIGTRAELAVPALIELLGDEGLVFDHVGADPVGQYAAQALGQFGGVAAEAVPELVNALQNSSFSVKDAVVTSLGQIGPAAKDAVPTLLDQPHRVAVSLALARIAPADPRAMKAAKTQMRDDHEWYRLGAVRALRLLAEENQAAIVELTRALSDDQPDIRLCAAVSLLELSPDDDALRVFVTDREYLSEFCDDELEAAYVRVLPQVIHRFPPNIPTLSANGDDTKLEPVDLEILAARGTSAKSELPALLSLAATRVRYPSRFFDSDEDEKLIDTIVKVAGEPLPELLEALDSDDFSMRNVAAVVLGKMGANDPRVTRRLVERLDDHRLVVRIAAAQALGRLGADDRASMAGLRAMLKDDFIAARRQAADSLGQIRARRGKKNATD